MSLVSGILLASMIATGVSLQNDGANIVTSADLVDTLRDGDWLAKERRIEVESVKPAGRLSVAAVQALSAELVHSTELLLDDGHVPPETYPDDFDFNEYIHSIGDILAREQNPLAIDALVGVIVSGGSPFSAVLQFGELAVPSVVAAARSEHGLLGHVSACLDVLEQMLENPTAGAGLSSTSRALIRSVAAERFANPGTIGRRGTLASAAYLGIAIGDVELRAAAANLIDNAAELQARGVSDPRDVLFISDRLRQALAKFPAPQ